MVDANARSPSHGGTDSSREVCSRCVLNGFLNPWLHAEANEGSPRSPGASFCKVPGRTPAAVQAYELKFTFAVPQPTCWIQMFCRPSMSGARSWSETITCTFLKDASFPSPAR
jgi:hypothetical protein